MTGGTPDPHELGAWLRLLETPGIGRQSARRLLQAFGDPQAVFAHSASAWREVLDGRAAAALAEPPDTLDDLIRCTLDWLSAGPDRQIIPLGDPAYPAALLDSPDPPLLLYLIGQAALLQRPSLAMVGSRSPTPQGREDARAFARALSQQGYTIVSGLALGIDGAAHEGALEGPGSTVAVVGTGLDRLYPRQNLDLARRIATEGALISEFCLGTPPKAQQFPMRNRIIAGLSQGTLVVEAALQSGSLITARLSLEAGRDVYAIPGSIHNPQSRGCHALIKQGAKLIECTADLLDELDGGRPAAPDPRPDRASITRLNSPSPAALQPEGFDGDDTVLCALGHTPATLDVLQIRTDWDTARLSARLLELELLGQVMRLPGGLFQRLSPA
jgi:DNA processing protein